jgi:hypothetical protein
MPLKRSATKRSPTTSASRRNCKNNKHVGPVHSVSREQATAAPVFQSVTAKTAIQLAGLGAIWLLFPAITEARGTHVRMKTSHGPVHLWWPADYQPANAGVVVYVHGYFTDVDRAWKEHRLARQFEASRLNALFIACEAPDGPKDSVRWLRLDDLLEAVVERVPAGMPEGRVTVVGHSGAHRTITEWLDDTQLDTIVLVDALYGNVDEIRAWLDADPARRLINASALTRRWGDELEAALTDDALVFERLPSRSTGKMRSARSARMIYVRTSEDHMRLVTAGVAIPTLLRALQAPLVDDPIGVADAK